MKYLLSTIKNYISTGSFLLISALIYLFSDSNQLAKQIIENALPENGKLLAFITLLGLVFIYEVHLRQKTALSNSHEEMISRIESLRIIVEKGRLISDVNSAFTEFKSSGKEHITGEYYIKEILTLNDIREKLNVNSYTENKIDYLISKIKHDE